MATLPPARIYHLLGFIVSGDYGPFTFYTNRYHKTVWFLKAPPLEPPSVRQIKRRSRFQAAAILWKNLTDDEKLAWNAAADRAGTKISGYNLFVSWISKRNAAKLATVERQSAILVPKP